MAGLAFLALVGSAAGARAADAGSNQLRAALQTALDKAVTKARAPGAQATVVENGEVVWQGAIGTTTDDSSGSPVTDTTPFVLASTTKTVTATMIMQEVQAGERTLKLSTPLSKYYPRLSPHAAEITLEMLLANKSGLPDYNDKALTKQPRHTWTREEVLKKIEGKEGKPPGTSKYVNANWIVLGGILEKVSGITVEKYFEKNIAKKSGMSSRSTFDPSKDLLRELAHPYESATVQTPRSEWRSDWIDDFGPPTSYYGHVFTDGGLISTATDLAKFGNALFRNCLVDSTTLKQMKKDGLGITVAYKDDHTWYGFSGSYGGYESENWTDPGRGVTITVTTNLWLTGEPEHRAVVATPIWDAVVAAYDKGASPLRPELCKSPT